MAEDKAEQKLVKYFDGQFDDEDVLLVFRRHPIVMRKGLIISLASWLIGPIIIVILTYVRPNNPPTMFAFFVALAASIIVGLILLIPSWISWYFSIFIVTTLRFIQITQKGLFHSSFADMNLAQIQQVNYEISGMQETMLGFGTIKMQTYLGELVIHDVHHPAKTQGKIVSILRDHGVTPTEPPFKKIDAWENQAEEK